MLCQNRTIDYNLTQRYFHLCSDFSRIQPNGISILPTCKVKTINFLLSVKTDIFHFLLEIVVWSYTVCNKGLLYCFSKVARAHYPREWPLCLLLKIFCYPETQCCVWECQFLLQLSPNPDSFTFLLLLLAIAAKKILKSKWNVISFTLREGWKKSSLDL